MLETGRYIKMLILITITLYSFDNFSYYATFSPLFLQWLIVDTSNQCLKIRTLFNWNMFEEVSSDLNTQPLIFIQKNITYSNILLSIFYRQAKRESKFIFKVIVMKTIQFKNLLLNIPMALFRVYSSLKKSCASLSPTFPASVMA